MKTGREAAMLIRLSTAIQFARSRRSLWAFLDANLKPERVLLIRIFTYEGNGC